MPSLSTWCNIRTSTYLSKEQPHHHYHQQLQRQKLLLQQQQREERGRGEGGVRCDLITM